MFINDETLSNIIKAPLMTAEFNLVGDTLRGIIRDSESFSEINMKAGREYLSLLEEGRGRAAELFDNLAFWAFHEMERVPEIPR